MSDAFNTPVSVDPRLLEVLVCPVTRGRLTYDRERNELVSAGARLAFPIRDIERRAKPEHDGGRAMTRSVTELTELVGRTHAARRRAEARMMAAAHAPARNLRSVSVTAGRAGRSLPSSARTD